jgi:hypothetical protein
MNKFVMGFSSLFLLWNIAPAPAEEPRTLRTRFDVVTFCCPCSVADHLCQPQFDRLNWGMNPGHFLAMGSDSQRMAITNQNNELAAYYNNFNEGWSFTAATNKAGLIERYVRDRFTRTGAKPKWIVLNEISAGQWPTNQAYRQWAIEVVRILHRRYGLLPILCAPFATPKANGESWKAIAENAFIGIECYLSGEKIKQNEFSVAWCEQRYVEARSAYEQRGVPLVRLFLVEHFGQTPTGVNWGRGGVSAEDWSRALRVRSEAAHKVGFAGFVSYAWAKNRMKVSDAELLQFEDTYRAQTLP